VRSIAKGLATLPPVVWFPAAMIVIGLSTPAILLVMVIGGAPPVARSVIDGVEATASRRGAAEDGGPRRARLGHVVIPGALPDALGGVRRSWALCWTALLTGEILLTLATLGIGGQLVFERGLNDYVALYEAMVVIFILGVVIDGAIGVGSSLLLGRRGPAR
jgi:NitT/TauT family transport system permease protein